MSKKRIDQLIELIGGRAYSSRETLAASYQIACDAIEAGIPGDFVECGVAAGVQAAMMAYAIMDTDRKFGRRVWLYDTFSGIPAAGPEDLNWTHPPGTSACSLAQVQAHMDEWHVPDHLLVCVAGLVENTTDLVTPELGPDCIAVLRIDVDLYAPTKHILKNFLPRVSPGGWVICDDFGLPGARKAVLEHIPRVPIYWQPGRDED